MVDKFIKQNTIPKKPKLISISRLQLRLTKYNFDKLSESEKEDRKILEKIYVWQTEYNFIAWEDFKDNYFKCSDCGKYDNEPCNCYDE